MVQWAPIALDVFQMSMQAAYLHKTEGHTQEYPRIFFVTPKLLPEDDSIRNLESQVRSSVTDFSNYNSFMRFVLQYGGCVGTVLSIVGIVSAVGVSSVIAGYTHIDIRAVKKAGYFVAFLGFAQAAMIAHVGQSRAWKEKFSNEENPGISSLIPANLGLESSSTGVVEVIFPIVESSVVFYR